MIGDSSSGEQRGKEKSKTTNGDVWLAMLGQYRETSLIKNGNKATELANNPLCPQKRR